MTESQYSPDEIIATEQMQHLVNVQALLVNERTQLLAAANRIAEIDNLLTAITEQMAAVGSRLPPGYSDQLAE